MNSKRLDLRALMLIFAMLVPCLSADTARADVTLKILASFNGTNGNGPEDALIQGSDGSFYGTTIQGGSFTNYGTVFKLSPDGTLTNLVSFNYTNGSDPQSGLLQGTNGNLYGTCYTGGSNGDGVVFTISTNGASFSSFAVTPAYFEPNAVLVQNPAGDLLGVTQFGGAGGFGCVFQLTLPGALSTLASFNGTNGAYPYVGGLLLAGDGNYYGTSEFGGNGFDSSKTYSGFGTVFKMTTNKSLSAVASFNGTNGTFPVGVLAEGLDGGLYGVTSYGGPGFNGAAYSGDGTIFKITTNGQLTTLALFHNLTNGANPFAGPIIGTDGNIYGTTQNGGTNFPPNPNAGTVFQLTPDGALKTLISFTNSNGGEPIGGVLQGSDGNFYGTTTTGGTNGYGNIFRLSVPGASAPKIQTAWNPAGGITLKWIPLKGRSYQVQYIASLSQTNWNNLGTPILATNRFAIASDSTSPGTNRFYRLALLP